MPVSEIYFFILVSLSVLFFHPTPPGVCLPGDNVLICIHDSAGRVRRLPW